MIPPFRPDGYLPEGVHVCSEGEAIFRFGTASPAAQEIDCAAAAEG